MASFEKMVLGLTPSDAMHGSTSREPISAQPIVLFAFFTVRHFGAWLPAPFPSSAFAGFDNVRELGEARTYEWQSNCFLVTRSVATSAMVSASRV
jgi:hypothetical protein